MRPPLSSAGHDEWQVQVGPGQWVPVREVMRSVSAPDDPLYRKVLASMVDPQQTRDVSLRRYFWGVALQRGDAGLIGHLAAAALAGGENDPVILGELANWQAAHGDGLLPLPPPGSPFPERPDPRVTLPSAASAGPVDEVRPLSSGLPPGRHQAGPGQGNCHGG